MKVLFGSPGTVSGLFLRIGQSVFAAVSIAVMASAHGFSIATAFCYLIASMGLQLLWSFTLACLDAHALRVKRDMHNHVLVSLFVVGDWVTATLSLAAACSSAGVMVLFGRDTTICERMEGLSCSMYQVSITLAFLSWFLLAFSSCVMFLLAASN
ncbi:PREDICTED: CASP-like protein 5B3 [Ipomoea nil]|uniref:CASP-like protein 5B3 n=1 Tax=Ipomoea nil TaxID=35883 RepID=UPI00090144D1|nr:PREDICTED: CASP-like protein 5B3 [Ipomoea nil]